MAANAGVIVAVIVIVVLAFILLMPSNKSGSFVGAMARNENDVRLFYPYPGSKNGWVFNRGTWA
jgi:hypothetical protein